MMVCLCDAGAQDTKQVALTPQTRAEFALQSMISSVHQMLSFGQVRCLHCFFMRSDAAVWPWLPTASALWLWLVAVAWHAPVRAPRA